MQSALTHPPGHAYAHPHLPPSSFRSSHSGVTSLFGQADERDHGHYDSLAQPLPRQDGQHLQHRGPSQVRVPGAPKESPSPPARTSQAHSYPPDLSSTSVNATPSTSFSSISSSSSSCSAHPRPSSPGSAGDSPGSGTFSDSSPRLFLQQQQQQQQQQRQQREGKMVVTTSSTPVQTEDVRKMARYSVESYSPSPDANESLDKSLNDEDDDDVEDDDDDGEEDDEFSDGGHYRGPPPDYQPSEDHRFRFLQAPDNQGAGVTPPPAGGEAKIGGGREATEVGHLEEKEGAAMSMERQKRMFFQSYLNGSRQMMYPLRGYPTTSQDFQLYHHHHRQQLQQDQQFGYPRDGGTMDEAFDAYAMMRHHHQLRSGQVPVPVQTEPPKRYSAEKEDYDHHREGQGHSRKVEEEVRCKVEQEDEQPQSLSPRKESLPAYGFSPTSTMPSHQDRNGSDARAAEAFSPRRSDEGAAVGVKREPDSSPDYGKRPPPALPPSSSAPTSSTSMSSPLTKIPIPSSMPPVSPQVGSEGYPRHLASMREMMMTGSMVGHLPPSGPQGIMPRLNPRAEGHALGHLYFCHLCQYSGNSKDEFDLHMTIHFEHNCPHCDYTSRTEGRLKRHIKDFHSDPDSKQRTMPGRPKVFKCKQCDFSTTDKIAFWSHARVHIKEDKLLACPQCPFVTEYKHHLEYHLRNHFGSKPHKCGKCNYSCVNKSMLNSHMKSHTNVYQYRCSDCTYATKYCHSLKLHLKKYNHKPATVLNSDGSLPLGMDAEISGLSILAKRGPPRGPRGLRKDKDAVESPGMSSPGGPGFVPGFPGFPLSPCHPQRGGGSGPGPFGPGVPPMLNGGMFPGMWPMMPNGMHHPPPLMPVGSFNGPMALDMEGRMEAGALREAPNKGWARPRAEEGGSRSEGQGPVQCKMCCFTSETLDELQAHIFKVHASENRDLINMLPYNLNPDTLLDGAEPSGKGPPPPHSFPSQSMSPISKVSRRFSAPPHTAGHSRSGYEEEEIKENCSEEARTPSRRHTIPTQSPYRPIQIGGQSEAPWLHRRKEMHESVRWPLHGGSYLGSNFDKDGKLEAGPEEAERGADILRQMTRRFGDNVGPAMPEAAQPCAMTSDLLLSPSSMTYPTLAAAAMSMAATIAAQATRESADVSLARGPPGLEGEVNDPGTALDLTRKPSPPVTSPSVLPPPVTMTPSDFNAATETGLAPPPMRDLPVGEDSLQQPSLPEQTPQQQEGQQKSEQRGEKRPLAALEGSSAHSGEENGAGEDGVSHTRKRSRKGKAIKRVRPEHVPMSPDFLATGDHSERENPCLEELSVPASEVPTSSPTSFKPNCNARAPGMPSNAVSRVDASTGPEEEEEEHFKRLQEELQLLNNQNVHSSIHGASPRTFSPCLLIEV